MSENELVRWTSDEARKHNYMGIYEIILKRGSFPLNKITSLEETKRKVSVPIDLSIFKNATSINFSNNSFISGNHEFETIGYFGNLQNLTSINLCKNNIRKIIPLNHYYQLVNLFLSKSVSIQIRIEFRRSRTWMCYPISKNWSWIRIGSKKLKTWVNFILSSFCPCKKTKLRKYKI